MDPSSTQNKNMVEVGQSLSQSLSHFRVLRMGCAESQILVTHSYLTNFRWSGELHHDLHLATLPIVIKKLVNWLTKKLYEIGRLSCYDQYFYWGTVTSCDQPFDSLWPTFCFECAGGLPKVALCATQMREIFSQFPSQKKWLELMKNNWG